MKAFGRTLWKVADALLSRKRSKDACGGGGGGGVQAVVAAVNEEEDKVVQGIMTDRLANREERYGNHLATAGAFDGGMKRPQALWKRMKPVVKGNKAMSDNVPPKAASEVTY